MSRSLTSETVAFISLSTVQEFAEIDSESENYSRTFRPTGPVYISTGAGVIRIRKLWRNRPNRPRRASCVDRRRGGSAEKERVAKMEVKRLFSSGVRGLFRPIYFQAGISVAVTSARNSGQIGFVARF